MERNKQSNAEYIHRINKTIDYIELNVEKPITLEALANVANFSRFHFTRIFQSIVGESPFRFILRLRLEKAATLLLSNQHESISEIAYRFGFSDISIFSRNFRKYFKVSPTQYRTEKQQNSKISQTDSNKLQYEHKPEPYFCHQLQTIKWKTNMEIIKDVEVKVLPKMTLAYVRNIGAYDGNSKVFQDMRDKLFTWAGARGLIGGEDFRFLVIYHDNPDVTVGENHRMSMCIGVPPETKVEGEVGKMEIEEANYAVTRFELTGLEFPKAWQWVYGQWLPNSGYQPADAPCFEQYLEEPKDGKYNIEICVPVKPL